MPNTAKLILLIMSLIQEKTFFVRIVSAKICIEKKYSLEIILINSFLVIKNKMQQKLIQTADRPNGSSYYVLNPDTLVL